MNKDVLPVAELNKAYLIHLTSTQLKFIEKWHKNN